MFRALASPLRRRILDALQAAPLTTGALAGAFPDLDRTTVMQHLRVLEGAGLVTSVRRGRERWNYLDALPIKRIHDRWIGAMAARAAQTLSDLAQALDRDVPNAPDAPDARGGADPD